ncbi:MAG: AmmeMemoRadiSam system protein A [Clostridiaceae bacterium]|nr:AmmeMemoRadiSam system protein A [Clostridiaceae bacterium]
MNIIGAFIVPHPPIILPEVGCGEEKKIYKTSEAYFEVARKIAALKPDTIILSSPHATLYADYFHISPGKQASGDLRKFRVYNVSINTEYDEEFALKLTEFAESEGFPAGTRGEREKKLDHGTLIPLYFINRIYIDYKIVRIGLSGLSPLEHYRFGKIIKKTTEKLGRRTVFIASGDLSHRLSADGPYGFAPEGPEFDKIVTKAMDKGDFLSFMTMDPSLSEAAGECGLRSFIIMAGALDGKAVESKLLSYEGTFGVGYAVAAFDVVGNDENRHFDNIYESIVKEKLKVIKKQEDSYVRLARLSLESYVKHGRRAEVPRGLPEEMLNRKAGVFVSLKKHGQLRGCIGTISPVTNSIAEEILRNAISAGTEDPRFPPVTESELPDLVYSVDVLSEPKPINSMDELDVKRYGVIVTSGHRRGLLLPNLDGVNTPEQQVSIAMLKAGISPDQSYSLERFEVVRHK